MDVIFQLLRGLLPPGAGDAIGVFVAAMLTFMVFTYAFGDNLFFRIAQHILIGTVAAYAVVVAVHEVILGRLLCRLAPTVCGADATANPDWLLIVPLILGIMLLAKARPETAWLGNVSLGFLLGVGAALSISGALFGTLLPQVQATAISLFAHVNIESAPSEQLWQIVSNLIVIVGTLGALLSFHYLRGDQQPITRARNGVLVVWGGFGRVLIWITLGAFFAGLALSRITLLVSRVQFLLEAFKLSVR
ncbi:MAG: hypothetical protein ABI874_05755 [Chloroflexota bacterium]